MQKRVKKMSDYRFVTHTDVPDRVEQVTELNAVAFAEYEGAPVLDETFTHWYLQRPGSTPGRCVAALDPDDEMVSMVLVAIQPLQIGGRVIDCGIIDSVATHPGHRRHGLARRLMEMAHDIMQGDGADAAVLYTDPNNYPYEFYQSLGYQTRAMCQLMRGSRRQKRGGVGLQLMHRPCSGDVAELLDEFYADHEGYARMDGDVFTWHKIERPEGMEVAVLTARIGEDLAATCTYAEIELLLQGSRLAVATISDFAYRPELCDGAEALKSMLAVAPQDRLVSICDEEDPLAELYKQMGFTPEVNEVAMILPFTNAADQAVAGDGGPWYPMVESIIGV
ncbi:MAG: GNAT family N-acetyltransferase [Armatimonadota bacterium]